MTEEDLQIMSDCIQKSVKEIVNGKIDNLNQKFDIHAEKHEEDMKVVRDHMTKVEPYLEGVKGIKVIGDLGKWVVGLGVVWIAIRSYLPIK